MRVARVQAQAKVNLLLSVGPRDDSGYHELCTLFLRLDYADRVVVRVADGVRSLDCAGPGLPRGGLGPAEENLAYRAAVAYAQRTGWPRGFAIELTKNIPVGGGLGGGSADAGAVLRALDALASAPIGDEALRAIAAKLGADVPFLTSTHAAAFGTGRGDVLRPVEPPPSREVLLVVPAVAVRTADAYRWLDEERERAGDASRAVGLATPLAAPSWEVLASGPVSVNDFEPVVEARHPELRRYREQLARAGARIARLSGSGATVFGVFDAAAPSPRDLALDTRVIATRTSTRVVQVEVLE